MTDDRRFYVLGKGRLSFPDAFEPDEISLRQRRARSFEAAWRLEPFQIAEMAHFLGRNPIPHLVQHDPQKLLPSPERVERDRREAIDRLWDGLNVEIMEAAFAAYIDTPLMPFPGASKPVRYEIEGGHFFMQPPGTFDPDEEFIDFDKITIERRMAPFVAPRCSPSDPAVHWKKAVIVVGDKPGDIARQIGILSAMPNVLGIDIDIQPSSGVLPGDLFNVGRWNEPDASPLEDIARWRNAVFREKPMNRPIETYAMGVDHTDIFAGIKPVAKKPQKGYLKHDPTKNHSRRRRR